MIAARFGRFLLAAIFLAAVQAALAHPLAHDAVAPGEAQCETCCATASLAAALPSAIPDQQSPSPGWFAEPAEASHFLAAFTPHFRSHAPPAFL
jgi:hypothetical protein